MPTIRFPQFKSLDDLTDNFSKGSTNIVFENREYRYMKTIRAGYSSKIIYRNEQEQHNLVIYMMGDVVVKVDGIYSTGEVAV